jgi:Leucine-rich repeat (LRR) protein
MMELLFVALLLVSVSSLCCGASAADYYGSDVSLSVFRCTGNISQSEYDGLTALYDATNGPFWRLPLSNESIWYFPSSPADPCGKNMWQGLFCAFTQAEGMCTVALMDLQRVNLVGSLPTEFGLLTGLKNVSLDLNALIGSIPTTVGLLSNLINLNFGSNLLSSSIPSELGQCTKLFKIDLQDNHLTGTIPPELFQLTNLHGIVLDSNRLHGTISSQMQQLSRLERLYLDNNMFYGTLSPELGDIQSMVLFSLTENSISGTIPDTYFGWSNLVYLYLNFNALTGTVSEAIGNCTSLTVFDVDGNEFTGAIPVKLFSLTSLTDVYLPSNSFTGTISEHWANLVNVNVIALEFNLMTGSITTSVTTIRTLQSLDVESNYFTGNLPVDWDAPDLQSLTAGSNLLTGSLPVDLMYCDQLGNLNVSFNRLTGSIDDLFADDTKLRRLLYFDAAENALSGSFPASMFGRADDKFRSLEVVVLYSNCITGSLPDSICSAQNLTTLVLDSVGNAPACAYHFAESLSAIFKANINTNALVGGIPSCIFGMPNLQTLHLSGNGLTGTLPDLTQVPPVLDDISLASNVMTDKIPQTWQDWPWVSLDLSDNKLSGILYNSAFENNHGFVLLDLTVNRLSGNLPASLFNSTGVDILDGNLFQCKQDSKPKFDPNSEEYVCGSSDFDVAIIVWLVIGVVTGVGLIWSDFAKSFRTIFKSYFEAESVAILHHITLESMLSLRIGLVGICQSQLLLMLGYVLVSMTSYVVMKLTRFANAYSTHTHQYAWVTTIAYLHGILPCVLLCLCVFVSSSGAVFTFQRSIRNAFGTVRCDIHVPESRKDVLIWLRRFVVLCIHMTVMILVNVLYVFAVIRGLSRDLLLLVQFLLGSFKLSWNFFFVSRSLRYTDASQATALKLSSFMYLFTFVISPVVATFFTDSTCFRYLLTGQAAVTSTFATDEFSCDLVCDNFDNCVNICVFTDRLHYEVTTSVTPGWVYSYQCSSALLVNYTSVLLFSFTISGMIVPLFHIAYCRLSKEQIEKVIPRVVRDSIISGTFYDYDYDASSLAATQRSLFKSFRLVSRLCLNSGVLVTFGLASPVLSLAICWDSIFMLIISVTYVERVLRGAHGTRNLSVVKQDSVAASPVASIWTKLEGSAAGATNGIGSVFWMINIMLGIFWSLFVFDMIADVYGNTAGGLVILVPTVGNWFFLWGFQTVVARYWTVNEPLLGRSLFKESPTNNPIVRSLGELNDAF